MGQRGKKAAGIGLLAALALAAAGGVFYGRRMEKGETEAQEDFAAGRRAGGFENGILKVSEAELKEAKALFEELSQGDLEAAARRLEEQAGIFAELYYETMGEGIYRFDGEAFREELSGRGMALAGPSLVFFGDFGEHGPEGECLALQAVSLSAPRYDYARGSWMDGKMEGEGETGYRYYQESPEGEPVLASRKGNFSRDKLEGDVFYETQDQAGGISQWELRATGGVLAIGQGWEHDGEAGEYRLLSKDGKNEYAVREEAVGEASWRNLLTWPGDFGETAGGEG